MKVPAFSDDCSFITIDPADLSLGDAHRLLLHCVAPRPIAFVSTLSASGQPNLAPFSYFMAGGANPCSVVISPLTTRDGCPKDTLRNIRETGEYVISVVSHAMRDGVNLASAEFPYGVSEWEMAGFTPAASAKVKPGRVVEAPLAMECKLHQIVPHGTGPLSANYVIGEVVCFHVARRVLRDDEVDASLVNYLSRLGGDWYEQTTSNSLFEMPRPPKVVKHPPSKG